MNALKKVEKSFKSFIAPNLTFLLSIRFIRLSDTQLSIFNIQSLTLWHTLQSRLELFKQIIFFNNKLLIIKAEKKFP